jgi:putative MATE family efflux protein
LFYLAPHFYPYLIDDPEVIALGVPYYAVRVLAITFVGMNFAFRGYWNAIDMSRLYMSTLIIMHTCNIFLNYVLIFGKFGAPALGVTGAAIASAVSMVIGTAIYFYLGFKHARKNGFLHGLPKRREVFTLVRLSLPTGIQQFAFSAGFVASYWIIGQIGTPELAAANVLIIVMLVAILPGLGFGLSAATLVGQALGRGEPDDAARWGWDVGKVGMLVLGLIGLPMWATPDLILSIFIHDPHTVDLARLPMRLVGLAMPLEALGMITMHALLGAGDTRRVMLASVAAQWIIFLPLAFFVGPVLGLGLLGVWSLQVGYRAALSLTFCFLWNRGKWRGIVL